MQIKIKFDGIKFIIPKALIKSLGLKKLGATYLVDYLLLAINPDLDMMNAYFTRFINLYDSNPEQFSRLASSGTYFFKPQELIGEYLQFYEDSYGTGKEPHINFAIIETKSIDGDLHELTLELRPMDESSTEIKVKELSILL